MGEEGKKLAVRKRWFYSNVITIMHVVVFSDFLPDYQIYLNKHTSSVHANVLTVCQES